MRILTESSLSGIIKTLPYIAFEVDDVHKAIECKNIIIKPNSSSSEYLFAFVEENGSPIELIQKI